MPPYRKYYKKAKKAIKKRYFKGKGYSRPNVGTMVKDIKLLKSIMNSEKKNYITTLQAYPVGQLNINNGGYFGQDITPIPAQGTTDITRNGDSIKLCSAYIKFQFWDMTSTQQSMRVKIILLRVMGAPQTASTVVSQFLKPNPMVTGGTIYDFNSSTNPDFFGQYKIIKIKTFKTQDNYSSQVAIRDITIPLKFNHHIRFTNNTTTVSDGQLMCIVLTDSGNIGTISTVTGAPVLAASSGLNMNFNMTFYYYDN